MKGENKMPKKITRTIYKCLECGREHDRESFAKICEVQCAYGRRHTTEDDWRDAEPYSPALRAPTDKWTAWSNYGLTKGW